jgi:hypothetical protein
MRIFVSAGGCPPPSVLVPKSTGTHPEKVFIKCFEYRFCGAEDD